MNYKKLFCDGWEFSENPLDTEYEQAKDWHSVDIPHDWMIGHVKDLYKNSTGWYRKHFSTDKAEGMRTLLCFGGVYMDSTVYVNGKKAIEWKYGYTPFCTDITDLLEKGDNLIAVSVNYRCPNTRWYSGAGIFRDVYIISCPDVHILNDGIYVTADADGNVTAKVECERPEGTGVAGYTLEYAIEKDGKVICSARSEMTAADISRIDESLRRDGCVYSVNTINMKIDDPAIWDIDDPQLYTFKVCLKKDGNTIHADSTAFGVRSMVFDTDRGFLLNGRHVKLYGVCEHHDNGALGAAFNKAAFRRKLKKLREMGVNALRTSHNPPDTGVLELCDEMGFVVFCEGFDMWESSKTDYDYGRFFKEWVPKDVAAWIRRDRNHPCIAAWSIGNEIYDTHASDHGQEIASRLQGLVLSHDSSRYITIGSNYMQWEGAQRCAQIVRLAGYNYAERLYEEHHKAHPDWFIYGSETASTLQSRGIYHFPLSQKVLADDDKQCSGLGNCTTGWGAVNSEYNITQDRDAKFSAGQFIWTGFDYIGEPTPYDTKNSYFGQIDTAGFPKDTFYIYKGEWTSYKDSPFVHIFPYWDFTEGQDVDVRVASNAPKVALFRDGNLIAEKEIDHENGHELTLDASLKYTRGELCAVAYDENGNEIARDTVRSFEDGARIVIEPETDTLKADGRDLIYVDISTADRNGVFVANARSRMNVEVTGAGRLVGLDNGDSTDFEEYKATSRRLFSGRLVAIIAAKGEPGDIHVKVTSPGLPDAQVTLRALPAEVPEGISFNEENAPAPADVPDPANDIPLRKIAFYAPVRKFTSDNTDMDIDVMLYPADTTCRDIEYRITTALGIPSNLAEITASDDSRVKIHCRGDGEFYLRAMSRNGTDGVVYPIISALKFTAEGVGNATLDPYSFVTGGVYTIGANARNGIEHGAAFDNEDSWFGFENVDFGSIGSDTVTMPIYANKTTPVTLKVYDGTPEDGELIGDFVYHKPPIWLTYQEETFRLTKKLTGLHTISMRSGDGYAIKGFTFEKPVKETAVINAADADKIYGDRFTRGTDEVTGIGNNVVLEFGEFDFTAHKPSAVYITGKSALPLNSIHLVAKGETEKRILCEFQGADEYTERRIEISGLEGICNISFTFLPGSDFDFKSFRFGE